MHIISSDEDFQTEILVLKLNLEYMKVVTITFASCLLLSPTGVGKQRNRHMLCYTILANISQRPPDFTSSNFEEFIQTLNVSPLPKTTYCHVYFL